MMKKRRLNCNGKNGYQDLRLTIPEYPECEMLDSSSCTEVFIFNNHLTIFMYINELQHVDRMVSVMITKLSSAT
jgi:hypothetical protein